MPRLPDVPVPMPPDSQRMRERPKGPAAGAPSVRWEDPVPKPAPEARAHAARDEVVPVVRERARTRRALVVERLGLSGDLWYDRTPEDAGIARSRGGEVFLTGRITMIGGVRLTQGTWLWPWANDSPPPAAVWDMDRVRRLGEANGFAVLPWPGFDAGPGPVAEARTVAACVLDAEGLWTETVEETQPHFLLHDLAPIAPAAPAARGRGSLRWPHDDLRARTAANTRPVRRVPPRLAGGGPCTPRADPPVGAGRTACRTGPAGRRITRHRRLGR